MKKLILISVFIIISFAGEAQTCYWAKSAGNGSGNQYGSAITGDAYGNVYATGLFNGATTTIGNTTLRNANAIQFTNDIYVVKYDANGNVLWAKSAGGSRQDVSTGIAVDGKGYVYVTGTTASPTMNFDSTTLTIHSSQDIFLAKYSPNGKLVWAKNFGEVTGSYGVNAMTTDGAGNLYITGGFSGDTLEIGSLIYYNQSGTSNSFYVAKLDTNGNGVWIKGNCNTSASGNGLGIVMDKSGNIIVSGLAGNVFCLDTITINGDDTGFGFIAKYDSSGRALSAFAATDNSSQSYVEAVGTDAAGNIYMGGYFINSTIGFDTIIVSNSNLAYDEIFLVKFSPQGHALWARTAIGSNNDYVNGIATDVAGNTFITGSFYSHTLQFGNITLTDSAAYFDMYVAKYDSSGNAKWAINPSTTSADIGRAITCNSQQHVLITGGFASDSVSFGCGYLGNVGNETVFVSNLFENAQSCDAIFSINPDPSQLHHYIITDNSSGRQPLKYDWSWGDTSPDDTIPYPSHTYTDAGFYNICLSITDSSGCQSSYCDSSFHAMRTTNTMVYVNVFDPLTVAVKALALQTPQIVLYPNPTTNQLTIHTSFTGAATVSIVNVLAQETSPPTPLQMERGDAQIDVSHLDAGVYFLQLKSASGSAAKMFVKE